jgi:hypothetical protein
MTTLPEQSVPELHETPTGWLAIGNDYPRIGVTAATKAEAVREFERARGAWLSLDTAEETGR